MQGSRNHYIVDRASVFGRFVYSPETSEWNSDSVRNLASFFAGVEIGLPRRCDKGDFCKAKKKCRNYRSGKMRSIICREL